jgi:hypothetical protein
MAADDDGFVSSPTTTMKIIGCSSKDLNALIINGYIIPFDSGVIIIADWLKNNTIQKDRYTPTEYTKELEELELDSKRYRLKNNMETKCIQNVSTDKYSIDKYSIDNTHYSNLETKCIQNDSKNQEPIDYERIIGMYNTICKSLPKATTISEARKKAIKARFNTYRLEDFEKLFTIAESSSFLKGANDRNWIANLDWLIKDRNMAKVLDGYYRDNQRQAKSRANKGLLEADYGNIEEFENNIREN